MTGLTARSDAVGGGGFTDIRGGGVADVRGGGFSDIRGGGIAGVLADLVASGEPVLGIVAHAPHRARALRGRVGGFALCSWAALEDDPQLAAPFAHLVAVDPPGDPQELTLLEHGAARAHLAWGEQELRFARRIHEWNFALRDPLAALYRALRGSTPAVRRSRRCFGARGRSRGRPRSRGAWFASSPSSISWSSIARGRLSGASSGRRGPSWSARWPSGATIEGSRTDCDS